MILIALIIFLLYIILIIRYKIGWRLNFQSNDIIDFHPTVSVIIALRNEEPRIDKLIQQLEIQNYPNDYFNIICINDHSTDKTLELLRQKKCHNLIVLDMKDGEYGKKNAILKGVQASTSEIVITTDADCDFSKYWIQTIVSYFKDNGVKLVSGPVKFNEKSGIFNNLQSLEFYSLIGSGAGAIGINSPIFCNAANMAFRRKVFFECSKSLNNKIASGDDVFLLHAIKRLYPKGISFALDNSAIVTTQPVKNFNSFFNQRKRWAGKSIFYKDINTLYVSFLVLFTNLFLVCFFVFSFFDYISFLYFILFYIIKTTIDILFLFPVLNFLKRLDLVKWIFPFELFYSFYIVVISIISIFSSYKWKGRTYKN